MGDSEENFVSSGTADGDATETADLVPGTHPVLGTAMGGPWPEPHEILYVAMGCFWGAERIFWQIPGVINTCVGYMGGTAPAPSYEEVCTGMTGHAETVRVVYDPEIVSAGQLLKAFWENHDPTQGDGQGNDRGTQYRSMIVATTPQQLELALESKRDFGAVLVAVGRGPITTEVLEAGQAGVFWPAEDYHQAYLYYRPNGYCNHGFKGFTCAVPGSGQ